MKFLIAGSGAIGSSVGGFLQLGGHEVYFLGRGAHIQKMKDIGLKITGIWGEYFVSSLRAFDNLNEIPGDFDVILLTVKSYDTKLMVHSLREKFGEKWIVSLQNGLGNWETIEKYFPRERIIGGRVIYGAEIPESGVVKITVIADDTLLGSPWKIATTNDFAKQLALIFNQSHLPTRFEEKIEAYLWAKVLYNNALNPLGAILESNYGKMVDFEPLKESMFNIIKETYKVGKALDVEFLIPTPEEYFDFFVNKLIPPTYEHFPSMYHDLKKKGKTEIDALNGAISRYGKKLNIPTPTNDLITAMVKFLEKKD